MDEPLDEMAPAVGEDRRSQVVHSRLMTFPTELQVWMTLRRKNAKGYDGCFDAIYSSSEQQARRFKAGMRIDDLSSCGMIAKKVSDSQSVLHLT